MISRLHLQNFAAFRDLSISFGPKINIIIGENGYGKTQLLKAAYSLTSIADGLSDQHRPSESVLKSALTKKLTGVYKPPSDKVGAIHHRGSKDPAQISVEFSSGQSLGARFTSRASKVDVVGKYDISDTGTSVFIPTKEVLSFLDGITNSKSDRSTLDRLFDSTYFELAAKLMVKEGRIEEKAQWLIETIVNKVQGRFEFNGAGVQFKSGEYKEYKNRASFSTYFAPTADNGLSTTMTAEGHRKIGVLQRLLQNGLIGAGVNGPLFWDEPESNLNPSLMRLMVEVLLELSRKEQQIILATHDYILLKWFDLLRDKKQEHYVRFHSLYRDDDSGDIKVESVDDYRGIYPNAIADTFNDITKEQVFRKMGSLGK